MKLKEILLDVVIGTTLFEMARSRADAKQVITAISPQIFKHFVKLFVFNSPENKNHWITELNTFFHTINDITLKPNNKKPDKNTVYNWMVFDSSPHYDEAWVVGFVKISLLGDYKDIVIYDYDAKIVLNKILGILQLILTNIEQPNKFITVADYL